jgi:hypothetical protein
MFMRSLISRTIVSVLFSSLLLVGGTAVQAGAIQGQVKGPDGKPISGAEVRVSKRDSKQSLTSVKTDRQGNYVFNGLAVGAYKLTALVNGVPTIVDNVKSRADGAVRIDFDIKATAAMAAAKKKPVRRIWVAAETGTHIGGGTWVEVDENGRPINTSGTNRVERAGSADIRALDHSGVPVGN